MTRSGITKPARLAPPAIAPSLSARPAPARRLRAPSIPGCLPPPATAPGGSADPLEVRVSQERAASIEARNAIDPLDPIAARRIARLVGANPVAWRSLRQVRALGTSVVLDFGLGPCRLLGMADVVANRIKVFVRNHRSVAAVVATLVHESSHVLRHHRGDRSTQLDEVRARSRAFLYREGRRPSRVERRAIWLEVQALAEYADLPVR